MATRRRIGGWEVSGIRANGKRIAAHAFACEYEARRWGARLLAEGCTVDIQHPDRIVVETLRPAEAGGAQ